MPEHIETIYIEQFENQTTQFDLGTALFSELSREIPATLGLQPAGREVADAVLTGQISGYADQAQNLQTNPNSPAEVDVLQRQVTITLQLEMLDVERNVILWGGSITGRGEYRPDAGQTYETGRLLAIENLLIQIRDRAQSQW
ncbi:MAG: LPS assembly lipoprotein LptE [Longimicrobiales bacterium]